MRNFLSSKLLSNSTKKYTLSNFQSLRSSSSHGLTNAIIKPGIANVNSTPFSLMSPMHHCRSKQIHQHFSNSVGFKHFVSTFHTKTSINSLVGTRVRFLRANIPKADKRSSPWSSTSQKRNWSSQSHPQGSSTLNVILGIVYANAAVAILWRVMDKNFMKENFAISVENIKSGRLHTMITYAFSHNNLGAVLFNMLGLYSFGMNIGRIFGTAYLLKLYFKGIVVGGVCHLVHHTFFPGKLKMIQVPLTSLRWYSHLQKQDGNEQREVLGIGANAAANAVILLHILLFPKGKIWVDFLIPVPAKYFGMALIGLDLWKMLEGRSTLSGSANLGGAAVAAAAWLGIRRRIKF